MKVSMYVRRSDFKIGLRLSVWVLSAALACTFSSGFASAAAINEAFDSPEGGLPANFTLKTNDDSSTSKIVNLGTEASPNRYLQLGENDNTNQNAALYYTAGTPGATVNNQFGDFSGSILIRLDDTASITNGFGLMLRAQSLDYNAGGYYLTFSPRNGSGRQPRADSYLEIFKDPTAYDKPGSIVAASDESTMPNWDGTNLPDGTYKLVFSFVGSTLSAQLYNTDDLSKVLLSVSTDQATDYTSGYIGLRSSVKKTGKYGYFRDLQVTVPEPASLSLLGMTGALLLIRRR